MNTIRPQSAPRHQHRTQRDDGSITSASEIGADISRCGTEPQLSAALPNRTAPEKMSRAAWANPVGLISQGKGGIQHIINVSAGKDSTGCYVMAALTLAAVLFGSSVQAAPPEPGSEDADIMGPYADWVEHQHDANGAWCCTISDGRTVEARISGASWEVHITPDKFPGSHDHWQAVPDEKVLRVPNPTGFPIAWVMNDRIFCFAPPSGV